MSQQETATPVLPPKKQVRKEVGEKLAGALAEYKQELGEKTWTRQVKSISKLISRDLLKVSKKKEKATKKNAAKKARKKTVKPKAAKQ